ncbi:MAG: hypothetical protein UZ13_03163 [Chloroflexi bacterium OLB13]|nr:MAG: hypothetical protein UZ13_03163 [Chloroflexi bacterium OLB13]
MHSTRGVYENPFQDEEEVCGTTLDAVRDYPRTYELWLGWSNRILPDGIYDPSTQLVPRVRTDLAQLRKDKEPNVQLKVFRTSNPRQ